MGGNGMSKLTVFEYPYQYAAWRVNRENPEMVIAERRPFESGRRAVEDYRLCGVYGKTGEPYCVTTVDGKSHPDLQLHEAIVLELSEQCCKAVSRKEKVLISSGYCALAPAIVGGIQQAIGTEKRIGVVWIDAHGDNRIVKNSSEPEVRFVSFPLSTILGQTMDDWRTQFCRLEKPCSGDNILISDARCASPQEQENLRQTGVHWVGEHGFEEPMTWESQVQRLSDRVDAIFLMVDADIMTSDCIPAYFRKEPGGHSVWKVMQNVRMVMQSGKVVAFACFCVDFDKYEQGGDVTYLNGMRVIGAGLESWR